MNLETGQRIKFAEYRPLDKARVAAIKGRLGDLLHPKEGLLLGVPKDPWYSGTKAFLEESAEYLSRLQEHNSPFFSYDGVPRFEMIRAEPRQNAQQGLD